MIYLTTMESLSITLSSPLKILDKTLLTQKYQCGMSHISPQCFVAFSVDGVHQVKVRFKHIKHANYRQYIVVTMDGYEDVGHVFFKLPRILHVLQNNCYICLLSREISNVV